MNPIRVLVVEDSATAREYLEALLDSDPAIRVVGAVGNGDKALEFLARREVDVVTMDVHMPGMDGYEVTRRIMETRPLPIVVVSASWDRVAADKAFRALEAGAVAAVEKPAGLDHPDGERAARELVQTVKLMSEVKVVRRWRRRSVAAATPPTARHCRGASPSPTVDVIAIGASTGGPPVLQSILAALGPGLSVPVLVVQHIASGFVPGLISWLEQTTGLPVRVPEHGEPALPGHVYLAPDGRHLEVIPGTGLAPVMAPPENGHRPSVDRLFRSVARVSGPRAAGVLLTGMGCDGAAGLALMRERGAVTIAQDAASSVIYGMPRRAVELGAACHSLPPEGIAAMLKGLITGS